MNTHNVLRLLHIVGGILWVGFASFMVMFLMPTLKAIGPASGAVMRELAGRRKLPVFMMAISWITILSGAALMWRDAGALGHAWFRQGMGLMLSIGALLAIVASFIGMIVNAPTARKIGAMSAQIQGAGRAPSADEAAAMGALQQRMNSASFIVALLLLGASVFMATARYI